MEWHNLLHYETGKQERGAVRIVSEGSSHCMGQCLTKCQSIALLLVTEINVPVTDWAN